MAKSDSRPKFVLPGTLGILELGMSQKQPRMEVVPIDSKRPERGTTTRRIEGEIEFHLGWMSALVYSENEPAGSNERVTGFASDLVREGRISEDLAARLYDIAHEIQDALVAAYDLGPPVAEEAKAIAAEELKAGDSVTVPLDVGRGRGTLLCCVDSSAGSHAVVEVAGQVRTVPIEKVGR